MWQTVDLYSKNIWKYRLGSLNLKTMSEFSKLEDSSSCDTRRKYSQNAGKWSQIAEISLLEKLLHNQYNSAAYSPTVRVEIWYANACVYFM